MPAPSPPQTLRVGVLRRGSGSFGQLTLTTGKALLESWPARRQLAVHDRRQLIVIRPRLDLFGHRTVFTLQGSTGTYGVRAGLYSVKRLEQAFLAAGFELAEQRTLFAALPTPPF